MTEPVVDASNEALTPGQLKEATLRGVRWIAIGRVLTQIGGLASSVLVARLLTPAEFGYAAVATFLFLLAQALPAGSFGSPLVRAEVLRPEAVRTALTLSCATGLVTSLAVVLVLEWGPSFFPAETTRLIQFTAPTIVLYGVGAVSQALLQRELDFRRTSINEVASLLPGVVLTIALAAAGSGGFAIVAGYVLTSLLSSLQAVWWRPPGRPGWDRTAAREIFGFGLPVVASSLLFVATRNIQLALLGARVAPTELGFFWRASQLGTEYQSRISGILQRILFPVLSRTRTRAELRAVRRRMVEVHCALLFPLLALLVVLAPVAVPWLFGSQWGPASGPTRILAIAGFVAVVGTGTGPLMMAVGKPTALTIYSLVALIATIVVTLATAPYGLIVVCWGVAAVRLANLLGTQYFLVQRHVGIPISQTLGLDVAPALVACAPLAAVSYAVSLASAGLPDTILLLASGVAGFVVYAVTLRLLFRRTWDDLELLVRRTLRARQGRTGAGARA